MQQRPQQTAGGAAYQLPPAPSPHSHLPSSHRRELLATTAVTATCRLPDHKRTASTSNTRLSEPEQSKPREGERRKEEEEKKKLFRKGGGGGGGNKFASSSALINAWGGGAGRAFERASFIPFLFFFPFSSPEERYANRVGLQPNPFRPRVASALLGSRVCADTHRWPFSIRCCRRRRRSSSSSSSTNTNSKEQMPSPGAVTTVGQLFRLPFFFFCAPVCVYGACGGLFQLGPQLKPRFFASRRTETPHHTTQRITPSLSRRNKHAIKCK